MSELQSMPVFDPTKTYDQLFVDLLRNLPDDLCETLRVGAIPHFLDIELAEVLFPYDPAGNLEQVASFPFVSSTAEGRYEYHPATRQILLNNWYSDNPERYRTLNGMLAEAFLNQIETTTGGSTRLAIEWVYHAIAHDPETGARPMANLFHELLETRELGAAERLVRLLGEQKPWLGKQVGWLEYFQHALAFQRYQPVSMSTLEELANRPMGRPKLASVDTGTLLSAGLSKDSVRIYRSKVVQQGTLLGGCVRRLQGKLALANHQWADGRRYLKEALIIFQNLENPEEQALTHLELGNRYYSQAVGSGGIQAEQPIRDSMLGNFLFRFSRLPLLVYRWMAEHYDPLPDLYDGSYQNWMVLRMLRLARDHYESAARLFRELGNQRGCLETDFYIGRIMLVLGYTGNCVRRCEQAMQRPLAVSSPYYSARINLVIAQTHVKHGKIDEARKQLEACLETFTRYGDWRLVLDAALALGTVLEKQSDWPALMVVTEHALEAARRSSNPLAETRLASRLDWYVAHPGIGDAERQKAKALRETVTCLAYIDRFPGAVRQSFHRLAHALAYPFVFLFMLSLIIASGPPMQFIEGELRYQTVPVEWTYAMSLGFYLVLPVLMVWGYYVLYLVIGQIAAVFLSFNKVDETQPETWSVEQAGIAKIGESGQGEKERRLDWEAVEKLVIDNKALYGIPIIASSSMHLVPTAGSEGSREPLVLPASIFRYGDMQSQLEKRLAGRVFKSDVSILRSRWIWISLLVGMAIALAGGLGLFGDPWRGCYGDPLAQVNNFCRPEYQLYVQPVLQAGLFIASLIFSAVTWLRWQAANRRVKKALE